VIVALVIVVGVATLIGVAWWWSGRSPGAGHNPLAERERHDAEAKAMKQYRPSGGHTPGPMI
jgi:hypothetical protein